MATVHTDPVSQNDADREWTPADVWVCRYGATHDE